MWTQNKLFLPQHPQPRPSGKRAASYQAMVAWLRERGPQTQSQVCEQFGISSTKASEMLRYGRRFGHLRVTGKSERNKLLIGVV